MTYVANAAAGRCIYMYLALLSTVKGSAGAVVNFWPHAELIALSLGAAATPY